MLSNSEFGKRYVYLCTFQRATMLRCNKHTLRVITCIAFACGLYVFLPQRAGASLPFDKTGIVSELSMEMANTISSQSDGGAITSETSSINARRQGSETCSQSKRVTLFLRKSPRFNFAIQRFSFSDGGYHTILSCSSRANPLYIFFRELII